MTRTDIEFLLFVAVSVPLLVLAVVGLVLI